jgi:hypothetical protein
MARKSGRSATAGQRVEPAAPKYIQITGKRVQGDNGAKHLKGARLEVDVDVTLDTAVKMLRAGTAMVVDGMTIEASAEQIAEQEAQKLMTLQKQRAEFEMNGFDRQSPETRELLRETNGEVEQGGEADHGEP